MAKFSDYLEANLRGFFFHDELDQLWACFETALQAMVDRRAKAQANIEAYKRYLEGGGEWEGELDEEGFVVWSREDALEIMEFNAYLAIDTLREAFITSLFHFWEKSAREWTGFQGNGYAPLKDAVISEGIYVSDDLDSLNTLNNMLKHSSKRLRRKLYLERPELFRDIKPSNIKPEFHDKREPWEAPLAITNDHLRAYFEIVRASGPKYDAILPQDRVE